MGGVLTGQSLIRAAELRSVTTDFNNYKTALGAFRDKYFALPGDMTNATAFWGSVVGNCLTVTGTGTQTCNGNGNGLIYLQSYDSGSELTRVWQHLINAGLIAGKYTYVPGDDGDVNPGVNVPRSKIANAGWSFMGYDGLNNVGTFPGIDFRNALFLGAWNDYAYLDMPALKAEDAWNIDTKMDDGKPNTGKVLTDRYVVVPNCIVSTSDAYAVSNKAIGCYLIFVTGY